MITPFNKYTDKCTFPAVGRRRHWQCSGQHELTWAGTTRSHHPSQGIQQSIIAAEEGRAEVGGGAVVRECVSKGH